VRQVDRPAADRGEELTAGTIRIGGRVVNDVAPKDCDIAMVFQSYALYPHMSVRQNLEFGLQIRRVPAAEIAQLVTEVADTLGIGDLLDRRPKQLSGGQRQRVAVGRAIVRKPSVFLFDEPLSNLDGKLRLQMRAEILKLQRRLQTTTIYVTHDQGGDDDGPPDRAAEPGGSAAGRDAARGLRAASQPIRRELHRHAADELPA
jgi:multiple sugar transport system ATP-binding protein